MFHCFLSVIPPQNNVNFKFYLYLLASLFFAVTHIITFTYLPHQKERMVLDTLIAQPNMHHTEKQSHHFASFSPMFIQSIVQRYK